MLAVDDALEDGRRDPCLHLALAEPVLDGDPVAVGDAVLLGILRVDGDLGPRIDLTQRGDHAMLGVERRVLAAAGREDQRILFGQVGVADRLQQFHLCQSLQETVRSYNRTFPFQSDIC